MEKRSSEIVGELERSDAHLFWNFTVCVSALAWKARTASVKVKSVVNIVKKVRCKERMEVSAGDATRKGGREKE